MIEITNDLDSLGYMELSDAAELLKAYAEQRPDFLGSETHIYFDEQNAVTFIQDDDGHTAMLNDNGKLEQLFSCAECGYEDFREDFIKHAATEECMQAVADALGEDINKLYPDTEEQDNADGTEGQGANPAPDNEAIA